MPADARHTVVLGAKASAGQVTLLPVQVSATSQIPVSWRHTVPAAARASAGQAALVPVQLSARSQIPAAGRQTLPLRKPSVGHGAPPPELVLQTLPAASHRNPPGQLTFATAPHVPAPSHNRGGVSTAPAAGQRPATQTVAARNRRHPPAPSQVPSVPQLAAPVSGHWSSGSCRSGTLVQAPWLPGSAHDRQVPVQVVLQQTPCWQMPELQSSLVAHIPPSARLPQLPLLQMLGGVQSALVVQVFAHVIALPHT
jgi:hypothetical protein